MERFRNNENVIIKNLEDTKETDPVMYEYLLPQDIHSLVVSPLFFKNEMIGFYGVDNPPKKLRENIATMFMIMGHFIVSLIRRRNLFNRLQKLSYCDQLTGLGNRYAMDDYIAAMVPEDSLGIVYCDVTGLKKVNDEQGHKQGDKLLLRACEVLKNVFQGNALFRIGGDEFLVLLAKLTEQELLAMIERLKEEMQKYSVIIAIGSIWCPDSKGNMDKLLNKADERMYEDKRKYYEQKAKDRRGRLSNEN
jgi:diguanylate cyclase (GGDEF)-like protein